MKIRLPPQREHDFEKIAVFEKTPKKYPPGSRFGTKNRRNSTPDAQKIAKIAEKSSFLRNRKSCVFFPAKKTQKKRKRAQDAPLKVKPTLVRRDARGLRGDIEGCITLHKSSCGGKTCEESCKGVHAELIQELVHPFSTPRRGAADSIAPRIPPFPTRRLGGSEAQMVGEAISRGAWRG